MTRGGSMISANGAGDFSLTASLLADIQAGLTAAGASWPKGRVRAGSANPLNPRLVAGKTLALEMPCDGNFCFRPIHGPNDYTAI
jgi:hypothetical protein